METEFVVARERPLLDWSMFNMSSTYELHSDHPWAHVAETYQLKMAYQRREVEVRNCSFTVFFLFFLTFHLAYTGWYLFLCLFTSFNILPFFPFFVSSPLTHRLLWKKRTHSCVTMALRLWPRSSQTVAWFRTIA